MKTLEQMSNDELNDMALRLSVRFDWSEWASPRYQLIQAIKAAQQNREPDVCWACGKPWSEHRTNRVGHEVCP